MNSKDCPFMSIEEMRKHEWTINWSGGKDSTATIIACIKYNVQIKEINYVRMMYDYYFSAVLPVMDRFVDECISLFRDVYDINVNVIESENAKEMICEKRYKRSKNSELNGKRYTLASLCMSMCAFNYYKKKALNSIKSSEYEMIGYAIDEPKRYIKLKNHPNRESILCTLGITEAKAFYICKRNNLLSPLYDLGIKRDGCWFCPCSNKLVIDYIKQNYPRLVDIIYKSFDVYVKDKRILYPNTNNWVKEYIKDRGLVCENS